MTTVVALVPAFDRADSIAATVAALSALPAVDRVLVIDDGSTDGTSDAARAAGAEVLRLADNRGKGGAVLAGAEATPEADVYLLIDADLASTAGAAAGLLDPVLGDEADMTIAVLPPAAGRGGFGKIRQFAAAGIRRACGREMQAPLSGQRAMRAELLRGLDHAERFGLEVALTIDAVRGGARVVEVELPMDHRHTGRSVSGFRHRGGQGLDIARSLWPRVASGRRRAALIAAVVLVVLVVTFLSSQVVLSPSRPPTARATSVVVFGIPHLSLNDLDAGNTPNLDQMIKQGALASMSVQTLRTHPSTGEAYATLSAGTRVAGNDAASDAYPRGYPVDGATAAVVAQRRLGVATSGPIVDIGAADVLRTAGKDVSSVPGALADALHRAHLRTAVVGNADQVGYANLLTPDRPAAVAAMDTRGGINAGKVDDSLLEPSAGAPFGLQVNPATFARAVTAAMATANLTVVDPGEMDRYYAYKGLIGKGQSTLLRSQALQRTDAALGQVMAHLPPHALLLVVGLTPPSSSWELTPLVAYGAGVIPGHLHSLSTNRPDVVAITDIAPTILAALGVHQPTGMVGAPLRYRSGTVSVEALTGFNRLAAGRQHVYTSMRSVFIVLQAAAYVLIIGLLVFDRLRPWSAGLVKGAVLTFAAWPLATFLIHGVAPLMVLGTVTHLLVWVIAALVAWAVAHAPGHPLAALARITGATVVVLVVDVATGANLQWGSVLGYAPQTGGRYTGLGNTGFAVLAACAVITAVIHVDRQRGAWPAVPWAAGLMGVVVLADGAPWLGADVGGILSLVPVFTLILYVLSGRRIRGRTLLAAVVATAAILGGAIGLDFLRPPEARTHLAKFVLDSSKGGNATFWDTVARKWSGNLAVLTGSVWALFVPILALYGIYVLVVARGGRRLLPEGSALRVGVVGALGVGVVGSLLNDSGIVILALVLVYIGPYLTLLALAGRRPGPTLLPPLVPANEPPAPTDPAAGDLIGAGGPRDDEGTVSTVAFGLAGAVVAALLWLSMRGTFATPAFARTNYRGATVPVAAGVVVVLTALLVAAGDSIGHVVRGLSWASPVGVGAVLVSVVGFGLLGLFDDLGASGTDRGFRGHVLAMAHGRLTTGGVKLVFGGLLALVVAASLDGPTVGRVIVDGALIGLAANVGNLFDRAPGRTSKLVVAGGVLLLAFEHARPMDGVAVVVGAAAGLLVFDLREELMLGDAGANVLGAVLGLGLVLSCPFGVRIGALVVAVILNVLSERVSFSKVIERVGPLRFLDRLGRRERARRPAISRDRPRPR